MILDYITQHRLVGALIQSAVVVLVIAIVRRILTVRVRKRETDSLEARQRLIVSLRNGALVLTVAMLAVIWFEELRTVAVSLVVIAGALVIAFKELIMCFAGGVIRATSDSFQVGDRIEVGATRGDVIDRRLMSTTLLEIGPGQSSHQHTGRTVTLPNSVFLTQAVINETSTQEYVLHAFTVPVKLEDDWQRAEVLLLETARAEVADYLEQARAHLRNSSRGYGLEPPKVDPRVSIIVPEPNRLNLLCRIPTPARRKGRVEQAIVHKFLVKFGAEKKAAADAADREEPTP